MILKNRENENELQKPQVSSFLQIKSKTTYDELDSEIEAGLADLEKEEPNHNDDSYQNLNNQANIDSERLNEQLASDNGQYHPEDLYMD